MREVFSWFWERIEHWWDLLFQWWTKTLDYPGTVLYDLLYTALLVVAYLLLRSWLVAPISRVFKLPRRRYTFRKVGNATLTLILLVVLLIVWIDAKGLNLAQFFGFVGAGLAVALAPVILNFFGWLFILVREPFAVKDRIQIHGQNYEVKGDVIDVRLFMFSVLEVGNWVAAEQSTGRIIHIPNSVVFTNQVANYTQGFPYIWNEIPITITFESDWETAHGVLTNVITEHSKEVVEKAATAVHETSTRFMVYYTRFTPIVWVTVVDIGVCLTMRYLCDARRRRSSEHAIWKDVLREFVRYANIDFAYPTTRYYYNKEEGKPGAGGPKPPPRATRPVAPMPTPPSSVPAPPSSVPAFAEIPVAKPLDPKLEPAPSTIDVDLVEADAIRVAAKGEEVAQEVVAPASESAESAESDVEEVIRETERTARGDDAGTDDDSAAEA